MSSEGKSPLFHRSEDFQSRYIIDHSSASGEKGAVHHARPAQKITSLYYLSQPRELPVTRLVGAEALAQSIVSCQPQPAPSL